MPTPEDNRVGHSRGSRRVQHPIGPAAKADKVGLSSSRAPAKNTSLSEVNQQVIRGSPGRPDENSSTDPAWFTLPLGIRSARV